MIFYSSYLHREVFADLIRRWMYAQVRPGDALLATRLVNFNNAYVLRYLRRFSEWIFASLHGGRLRSMPVRTKRVVKDAIVRHPPYVNDRIRNLLNDYHRYPGRFYGETPFHGALFFARTPGGEVYVGSNRIKRVRRLAEKTGRRIIDSVFAAIKERADALAAHRAERLGLERVSLVTAPDDMIAEFGQAEERLLEDLRHGRPLADHDGLVIDDVAGVKVILEGRDQFRLLDLLDQDRRCEIKEVQRHSGRYNATNLIVSYQPDKEDILSSPLNAKALKVMEACGVARQRADAEFARFVRDGEENITMEIIISDYQEMLESEVGRCMHEDRISEQRLRQEYRGFLAKNVAYLTEFLFAFAMSPAIELDELPIKLWNRYLPDYFDEVVKSLFNISPMELTA
jgi:hypothetical protein